MKLAHMLVASLGLAAMAGCRTSQSVNQVKDDFGDGPQSFAATVPTGVSDTGMFPLTAPITSRMISVTPNCQVSVDSVLVTFDNNGEADAVGPMIHVAPGSFAWTTSGAVRTFRAIELQTTNDLAPQNCVYTIQAFTPVK